MDLTARYYIVRISVVNHIRTDRIVRGNLLFREATELLKTYLPNADVGIDTSRTKFFDTGWDEYCVVAQDPQEDVEETSWDGEEIPF